MNATQLRFIQETLEHSKSALRDYIETIERTNNATLNFGHSVVRRLDIAILLVNAEL